jgi:hypothetical protein
VAKKKPQVPKPPSNVQAPKRREAPRSGPKLSLSGVPRLWWGAGGGVIVVVVAVLAYVLLSGGSSISTQSVTVLGKLTKAPAAGPAGPEGVPIPKAKALAPAGWLTLGQTRDGINCEPIESLAYHIHVHLTIFVNGTQRLVPYGIGIAPPRQGESTPAGYFVGSGSCFAWLHTHANDGIIHVESPAHKTYTLGDFFDIWGVQLGHDIVGPAHGQVTAFFNGRYYKGDPRALPLDRHAQIQLDVGKPLIAPETVTFPNGL